MERRNPYRVFISYSHDDHALAQRIVRHLEDSGENGRIAVLWDNKFAYGHGFHDQIRTCIAYAHVFLPIITPQSQARGWVHQEIGYAMALNVPVLPVAVGMTPGEMLEGLLAIWLESKDAELGDLLNFDVIDQLLRRQDDPGKALYTSAGEAEERGMMMRAYADEVSQLGKAGLVRQRGALSSFHIPRETVGHRVWNERYGDKPRSAFYYEVQRQERIALERHARAAGCKLIICPTISYEEYGRQARISRLTRLAEFLETMPDDKAQVARGPKLEQGENITAIGDWFSASSLSGVPTQGYRQTIFTRHAPTVRMHIQSFDEAFDEALRERPWPKSPSSRLGAMRYLKRLIAKLERQGKRRKK